MQLPLPFSRPSPSNLLITASFGYFVPPDILDVFGHMNALNVHPSLLPLYKGAAPIQWAIANGDVETGVTLQTLSPERFDDGLILSQERMVTRDITVCACLLTSMAQPIPDVAKATYSDLEDQVAKVGGQLLVNSLRNLPHLQVSQSAGA